MNLKEFFEKNSKAAMGFSGGVDSAYLLYEAVKNKADIRPYFVKTAFQPEFELEDAKRLAAQLNIELTVIEYDILKEESVAKNLSDRCYHCKHILFELIKERAYKDGYTLLLDGTNVSDEVCERPGFKALKELNVRSPLRECGLTKDEIRRLSKEAGLFSWDKPAYACLATRISPKERITEELLYKIECAENVLFKMGFTDFRIRIFHEAAKIQLKEEQFTLAFNVRNEILNGLKPYFEDVLLDLRER